MQRSKTCLVLLISTMIAYISVHSALASPALDTSGLVKSDYSTLASAVNGSTPASKLNIILPDRVSMGIRLPQTASDDISCGENRGKLKAFICSDINDPNNSTVIYGNSSDFNAIKDKLGCESPPVTVTKKSKQDNEQFLTSVAIWVLEGVEMFILLQGSIRVKPEAKNKILGTALVTSLVTMGGVFTTGVLLADSGREIPEKWVGLITGLTSLKASMCAGGWALRLAGGTTGKRELLLSGLLINVISNTFRQTGEGSLATLPLVLDKKYEAICMSLIPLGIIATKLIPFNPETESTCLRTFSWFVIASLGAGLFSDAWHEFEKIAGESRTLWDIGKNLIVGNGYEILSHEKLPMSVIAPFGYRPDPTIITVTTGLSFFTFVSLASLYHFLHRAKSRDTRQLEIEIRPF
ncbi:hypothetical protein [Endozoicomonas sp. 8E]|uniref:hypothetical protein n=1 Tax=Endozoicomonas sp. 8E TaxID=3035692 RepID=UPI0029394E0F|nr:hypothetical protein [Endozoicomonas sp. 8E]WOG29707.1 hypothetical protein P6910_08645 [Endozoicomonas sp. 8E]